MEAATIRKTEMMRMALTFNAFGASAALSTFEILEAAALRAVRCDYTKQRGQSCDAADVFDAPFSRRKQIGRRIIPQSATVLPTARIR
jgi:hypothetical protein